METMQEAQNTAKANFEARIDPADLEASVELLAKDDAESGVSAYREIPGAKAELLLGENNDLQSSQIVRAPLEWKDAKRRGSEWATAFRVDASIQIGTTPV